MTNIEALKALCNAIASTFYPDLGAMQIALMNAGIEADEVATPNDQELFKVAASLVSGYIESSRNENGISVSVNTSAIMSSLRTWCARYGLDADEVMGDIGSTIEDATHIW